MKSMKKLYDGLGLRDLAFGLGLAGITVMIAWLFYDSAYGLIIGIVCVPFFISVYRKQETARKRRELERQFQTGLEFAAGALEAGYSVENAWKEAEKELERLYGKAAVFHRILHQINQKAGMNEPLETMMLDFGKRTGSENIKNFAEVFFFAKRSGGNLTTIMRLTANRLRQNFQVQEEICLSMSSKQLEQRIMSMMPFCILAYLRFGSSEFLDPLYHNLPGVVIMTACLLIYGVAWRISVRITEIEI